MTFLLNTRGGVCEAIYFSASYCIPGFFLLSGYLFGNNKKISMQYIENKIIRIMTKLFGWIIFWTVIHYINSGELYNLWEQFIAGVSCNGILPVSWFLFTYCIVLIAGYPLYYLYNKYPICFEWMVIIWTSCLALGVGSTMTGRVQSMWLHLYLGYFCLGMVLQKILDYILSIKYYLVFILFVNICCGVIYTWQVNISEIWQPPASYYGKWYYTLWLISLFLIVSKIRIIHKRVQCIIELLSQNTFAVYLGHLPALLYITAFYPILNTQMAIIYVIIFFLSLELLAEIFKKMPVLRKLV